jgi:hypothetical protein
MLYTIANTYEDIEDRSVLDLGSGCGILGNQSILRELISKALELLFWEAGMPRFYVWKSIN